LSQPLNQQVPPGDDDGKELADVTSQAMSSEKALRTIQRLIQLVANKGKRQQTSVTARA